MSARTQVVWIAVLLGAAAWGPAAHAGDHVTRYELENGLKVMLRPAPGGATVAVLLLLDVGERHDPVGKSGLGHFVEHCWATCAAGDRPARDFRALQATYPDGSNHQTGLDYTVLAVVTRPPRLAAELKDAAARMGDVKIEQADLDRERPRVLQELDNMFRAFPNLAALNNAMESACPSPEGARRGGVPEQVKAITLEDVRTHHAKYYKPRNARLVLVGNFDLETGKRLVEEHFAGLPKGEAPPAPRVGDGRRRAAVVHVASPKRTGQPDWVAVAFPAPVRGEEGYAPFLTLAARLLGKASARKVPDKIEFLYRPIDLPEAFPLRGPVLPGESPDAAVERLYAYLREVAAPPPSLGDRALARMKFATLLGTAPTFPGVLQGNPYGVAFGLARRDQLVLDGPALGKTLLTVDEASYRRMLDDVLAPEKGAAAIVRLTE